MKAQDQQPRNAVEEGFVFEERVVQAIQGICQGNANSRKHVMRNFHIIAQ